MFFTLQRNNVSLRATADQVLKFQASELPGKTVNNGHSQALSQHSDPKGGGGGGGLGTEL